ATLPTGASLPTPHPHATPHLDRERLLEHVQPDAVVSDQHRDRALEAIDRIERFPLAHSSWPRVAGAARRLPALVATVDAGVAAGLPPRADPAARTRRLTARVALACDGRGQRCGAARLRILVENDIAAVALCLNDHGAVTVRAVHARARVLPP